MYLYFIYSVKKKKRNMEKAGQIYANTSGTDIKDVRHGFEMELREEEEVGDQIFISAENLSTLTKSKSDNSDDYSIAIGEVQDSKKRHRRSYGCKGGHHNRAVHSDNPDVISSMPDIITS